ncbi:MAG: TonB-dependent receptor [Akkermansia sp.]
MNCSLSTIRKNIIIGAGCSVIFACSSSDSVYAEPESVVLPELVVKGKQLKQFRAEQVSAATGASLVAEESPQSVDVMTRDLIEARNVDSLDAAMTYDSSVSTGGASLYSRTAGQYAIRGFSGSDVLIQGMPLPTGMGTMLDAAVIERIEVVKGPIASLNGGQSSTLGPYGAGGSVVLELRQPEMDQFTDVMTYARFCKGGQKYRMVVDDNRMVGKRDSESSPYAMRTILSGEYDRPFWLTGAKGGERYMASPSFLWQPDQTTKIVLTTMFQYQDTPAYQGIPVLGGHFVGPYDSWIGGPDSRSLYRSGMVQLHGEWDLKKVWTIRAGIGVGMSDIDYNVWALSAGSPKKGVSALDYYNSVIKTGMGNYEYSWCDTINTTWNGYVQGLARFDTGKVKHELLTGLDYVGRDQEGNSSFSTTKQTFPLANPTRPTLGVRVYDLKSKSDQTLQRTGLTVQELAMIDHWRFLAGVRMDEHFSDQGHSGFAFSPRVGVSRTLWERLVLFGNVSRSDAPNFGYLGEDGKELTSSWNATQYEAGARVNPIDKLWLNASWFMIDQKNTPEALPSDRSRYITNGQSQSKGVELSVNGQISDSWSSYLSYTYLNYRDVDQHLSFDRYAPHTVALWQQYQIDGGMLSGTTIGLGYRFKAKYFATLRGNKIADDYTIPTSHVFDLAIEVPLKSLTWMHEPKVRFALYNIFNEQYVASSRHAVQCFAGEPRTFEVCLKTSF